MKELLFTFIGSIIFVISVYVFVYGLWIAIEYKNKLEGLDRGRLTAMLAFIFSIIYIINLFIKKMKTFDQFYNYISKILFGGKKFRI